MNESKQTCAYCRSFHPCPCGECSYGICGNTKSQWLHEYVHEDMTACDERIIDRGTNDKEMQAYRWQ